MSDIIALLETIIRPLSTVCQQGNPINQIAVIFPKIHNATVINIIASYKHRNALGSFACHSLQMCEALTMTDNT